ncbi:MAG: 3-dehydroquinate synthase [Dehalococcoidales bacterium]|nr:3-dehydroquinate synthase [Dehalococcoidales bacterium]
MKSLNVELGNKSYDILIGSGLLDRTADLLCEAVFAKKYIIVTNPTVDKLFGNKVKENLSTRNLPLDLLTVPDGEKYKSLDSAGSLYEGLTACFAERGTPILALGGGVIGDLAGFVAATYMRGVPLIQIPTTLLAQVDSSIGGKVAVDHGKLKNKIGAFYQPHLVISDTDTLRTLPQKEFANGMAEVIKSAVIRDISFFIFIKENLTAIMKQGGDIIEDMVFRAAAIKASIVMQDERDTGLRNILNFGHTIGHAIESVSKFKISHGQAVAIGMIAEAKIARSMGTFEKYELEELEKLISHCGLPTRMPEIDRSSILRAMQHDKKIASGKIRFALPRNIGDVYLTDTVEPDIVREAMED